MAANTFYESPYAYPYKVLFLFGFWVIDTKKPIIVRAYFLYKLSMCVLASYGIGQLLINFFLVYGDFNKMTWNMCVTIVLSISLVTNMFAYKRKKIAMTLIENLHQDAVKRENKKEYEIIHSKFLKEFMSIKKLFFGGASIFIPAWLFTFYFSYLWGPRQLPLPAVLFFDANLENDKEYKVAFIIQTILGVLGLFYVITNKLSMYTLLIQISREIKVLLHDIVKQNDIYDRFNKNKKLTEEINPFLQKTKTNAILKEFAVRQQKLFQYVKDFEMCFNVPLFCRVFVGTVLATVSAIQCILAVENSSFSMNLTYQSGYVSIILLDIFLLSLLSSRLKDWWNQVGDKIYFTVWYELDPSTRKDIVMIILRSRKNPRITTAKLKEINLNFFMHTLKNIYSLLTLFLQMSSNYK